MSTLLIQQNGDCLGPLVSVRGKAMRRHGCWGAPPTFEGNVEREARRKIGGSLGNLRGGWIPRSSPRL